MSDEIKPAMTLEQWGAVGVDRCPRCNGEAVEITANGDDRRQFVCNRKCAHRWSVAFARETEVDPNQGTTVE